MINGFNVQMKDLKFEDLTCILQESNIKELKDFLKNIHLYLNNQDFFNFINFIRDNDKELLNKIKENRLLNGL
jgi:hypothetical protein